jgi:hypothetical protein
MSDERIEQVERACAELTMAGKAVTFVEVAARSGISRVTLYRSPELRSLIEEHRVRAREAHTLLGLAGEVANLRLALEALAKRVRRHEEQLRVLTREKKRAS